MQRAWECEEERAACSVLEVALGAYAESTPCAKGGRNGSGAALCVGPTV